MAAFVFYEHFLTFDVELEYFWTPKITGAVVLFLANRYLNIIVMGWLFVIGSFVDTFTAEVYFRLSRRDQLLTTTA